MLLFLSIFSFQTNTWDPFVTFFMYHLRLLIFPDELIIKYVIPVLFGENQWWDCFTRALQWLTMHLRLPKSELGSRPQSCLTVDCLQIHLQCRPTCEKARRLDQIPPSGLAFFSHLMTRSNPAAGIFLYGTLHVSTSVLRGCWTWAHVQSQCIPIGPCVLLRSSGEVTPMLAMKGCCNNLPGCATALCSEQDMHSQRL